MKTENDPRTLILCTVLADRHEQGELLEFDPLKNAEATFPKNPACQRVGGGGAPCIQPRLGLVQGERCLVREAFWSFLFVFFDEGGDADPALVELAERAVDAGVGFAEDLAREAAARLGPRRPTAFPCMLELAGGELRFVRAVPAEEIRGALGWLARP